MKKVVLMMLCMVLVSKKSDAVEETFARYIQGSYIGPVIYNLYQWWQQWQAAQRNGELFKITCDEIEDVHKVKELVEAGAAVTYQGFFRLTPLHNAAYRNHLFILKYLLSQGAEVDVLAESGDTPLHDAALKGHTQAINVLIMHGATVNAQNNEGMTPLHGAVDRNHPKAVIALINHKADITTTNNYGETPLHIAARNGLVRIALDLLCRTFFPPMWDDEKAQEFVRRSEKEVKKDEMSALLKSIQQLNTNADSDTQDLQGIGLNVTPWNMAAIADLLVLPQQQKIIKILDHQARGDENIKNLFIMTHSQRHLIYLQEVLALKDASGQTAREVAKDCQADATLINARQLLEDFEQAQTINDLYKNMREPLIEHIAARLCGHQPDVNS